MLLLRTILSLKENKTILLSLGEFQQNASQAWGTDRDTAQLCQME